MAKDKFTRVAIEPTTQRKLSILAKAMDVTIYSLVEHWAELEWKEARKAGLVTDAMLAGASKSKAG